MAATEKPAAQPPPLKLLDTKALAELVGGKGVGTLDPRDPVLQVAAVLAELQQSAAQLLSKVIDEAAERLAAASEAGQKAAQVKAESVITRSAEWSGQKIREAGEIVLASLRAEAATATANAEAAARSARRALWVGCTAAFVACSVAALLIVLGVR